jgi:hypothetical protein
MSDSPAPAATPKADPPLQNPMTKPVWLAALVGGLLGGLFSFALARTFPYTPKPVQSPPSEARQFADEVIGKLKDGKNDEFMAIMRPAFAQLNDEQFANFRKGVFDTRTGAAKIYGPGGAFEFCRETPLSPTLVRVTYLEKYAHGCIVWSMVVYNSPDGWRVTAFSFQTSESGFPLLQ